RAYNDSHSKMRSLSSDVKQLETATKSGSTGVAGFGSSLSSLMPSLSGLSGPTGALGIVTVGVGTMVTAMTAASIGVWELTKNFSDLGSRLQDMSDQVNLSVETLGTFQGVGNSVNVEVEQLSTGLVAFQKNLVSGNDALKALNVTSKDNEVALRQTFKALAGVTDKTLQSALAAEVFGKSGKAMLAIVKATGGEFDVAQKKLRDWNYLMSDQSIAIADEFGDKLGELGMRAQGIGNTIATETAPAFIAAFSAIEAALDSNAIEWKWWGEQIGNVIIGATSLIAGFAKAVKEMDMYSGPIKFIADWTAGTAAARDELMKKRQEVREGTPAGMGGGRIGPTIDWHPGGSKKDRAGAGTREKEDSIIRLTEQYADRLRTLTPLTTEQEIRQELLGKAYANSSADTKAALIVTGMTIDVKKKEIEAQKAATDEQARGEAAYKAFANQQFETLRQINQGQMTAYDQARVAMLDFLSVTTPLEQWWVLFNGLLIDAAGSAERLAKALDHIDDIGPAEIRFPEPTDDQKTPDIGLPPKEMTLDPMVKWRHALEEFSADITYTIDGAIRTGFEDGVGAGVKEFFRGVLEMARSEALKELQAAIFRAMNPGTAGEEGAQGGGGWFSQALRFGVSAIAGLFGGGSSGGLGSAAGGAIGG